MIELLISLVVVFLTGYLIIKKYKAAGVLFASGIFLLIMAGVFGHDVLPKKVHTTGFVMTDIFEFIKYMFKYRGGGLGMLIMLLVGFSAYMTHIEANKVVVKEFSKPLSIIKSPYVLALIGYIFATFMSLAVGSATGLGVLLMATLFPMLQAMGVSREAATATCTSGTAISITPTSGDAILSAEKIGVPIKEFFLMNLPLVAIGVTTVAVTSFFWNMYLDKKDNVKTEKVDVATLEVNAPSIYALLPFLPIIGVLIFDGKTTSVKIDIYNIILLSIFISAMIEMIRHKFNSKKIIEDLEVFYKGMGEAFSGVVVLLIAAGVFAQGLIQIGAINTLLSFAQDGGSSGTIIMLLLSFITIAIALVTGSGNAPFYAFVELVPQIAHSMGINPAYLVLAIYQVPNSARAMSPVSGVVVATSGMAKLSPMDVVKRTSVPMMASWVTILLGIMILIPEKI